ncbi:MAG: class I SAM-dependent methyltransferase [Planctomycetota bacterium]
MPPSLAPRRNTRRQRDKGRPKWRRIIENDLIQKVDYNEYRRRVQRVYDGPQGALLATASRLSLHIALGERLFSSGKFDLGGCRRILDVGSGAGQLAGHLLKHADQDAYIACTDLSHGMLRRARQRLASDRPDYLAADLSRLPFRDGAFDCVSCGYVLEHLPDPEPGLREMARVLQPGGKMLLLTTEDNFAGVWTSRVWLCRTYNRGELRRLCKSLGLVWEQELWFTPLHQAVRAGGIGVQIRRA